MDTSKDHRGWQQVLRREGKVGQAQVNALSDDNPAAPCHSPPPPSTASTLKLPATTLALPRPGHPQRRLVRQRRQPPKPRDRAQAKAQLPLPHPPPLGHTALEDWIPACPPWTEFAPREEGSSCHKGGRASPPTHTGMAYPSAAPHLNDDSHDREVQGLPRHGGWPLVNLIARCGQRWPMSGAVPKG